MRHLISNQRIVRGAIDATISHQFHDADGDAADPSSGGTVTVAVTRSDGTSVTVGSVAGSGTDPRTATVALAELDTVDQLTAVWSIDGTAVATDTIDVVGGVIGSVAALTAVEASISGESAAAVKRARRAAEDRFVSVTGRLPFQRLETQWFKSDGREWLRGAWWPDLVEVRWARVHTSSTAYTSLTSAQIAAIITPDEMSRFRRRDVCWPCGDIEIGYVAGMSQLPDDLFRAFAQATRREITLFNTAVPEQSATFGTADGASFGLARPGNGRAYGIDDIDDVYRKYADPRPMVA